MSNNEQAPNIYAIIFGTLVLSIFGYRLLMSHPNHNGKEAVAAAVPESKIEKPAALPTSVKVVMQATSAYDKMTVLEYIQSLLTISKMGGTLIEVEGWSSSKRYVSGKPESGFDVYFVTNENGTPVEMHWIVDETWTIYPVDALAKKICSTQKAKPLVN